MDFDTSSFINEIKKRPCIWDIRSTDYANKSMKLQQWEELVLLYGGNNLTSEEKSKLGQTLQKKWKNIRDCFVKESRKLHEKKSGRGVPQKPPYTYYKHLLFLQETLNPGIINADSNINFDDERDANTSQNEEETMGSYNTPRLQPKRAKKFKSSLLKETVDEKKLLNPVKNKHLEVTLPEDGDRMFFLSLVKDFKKVPEHLQLQTKAEIIQVILHAQQMMVYQPSSSYAYPQSTEQNFVNVNSPVPSPESVESMASSADTS